MYFTAVNRRRFGKRPPINPDAVSIYPKLTLWSDLVLSGGQYLEYVEGNHGTPSGATVSAGASGLSGFTGVSFLKRHSNISFLRTTLNSIVTPGGVGIWWKRPGTNNTLLPTLFARQKLAGGVGAEPNLSIVLDNSSGASPNAVYAQTLNTAGSVSATHIVGGNAEYYDDLPHHLVYQHTHTGTTVPYATKATGIYVDTVLKVANTTDNGPLYHTNTTTGIGDATWNDLLLGGQTGLSNSDTNHAAFQMIAWSGNLTTSEIAYLFNGGAAVTWAQFTADRGA